MWNSLALFTETSCLLQSSRPQLDLLGRREMFFQGGKKQEGRREEEESKVDRVGR